MENKKIKELQRALETASALADIIQDDYEDDVKTLDGYNLRLSDKIFELEKRIAELEARNSQLEAFVAKCADLEPVEHYLDKLGV